MRKLNVGVCSATPCNNIQMMIKQLATFVGYVPRQPDSVAQLVRALIRNRMTDAFCAATPG